MSSEQSSILQTMEAVGLVPVFNHSDSEVAKSVMESCYHAGVRVFEFTDRGPNALEVFTLLAGHAKQFPDLILGIGTIFSAEQADAFFQKGAQFIVSPAMIPELADYCRKQEVLWIPGCGTVTEIHQAQGHGARLVKVFPGNVLGPTFVSSVKAVFPKLPLMPTGGVAPNLENLKLWFDAGVSCVGMGSKLIDQTLVEAKAFDRIQASVAQPLAQIQRIRA